MLGIRVASVLKVLSHAAQDRGDDTACSVVLKSGDAAGGRAGGRLGERGGLGGATACGALRRYNHQLTAKEQCVEMTDHCEWSGTKCVPKQEI